ncbi:MAG: hypothetical protein PHO91_04020 [Patescibacteria group bacterium]|nr:hypothetical protein [Patescibacteria group bacterium]
MKKNILFIALVSLIGFLARLLPHLPNFSPFYSVLLFAGVYSRSPRYLLIPLGFLLLSDFWLGFYHSGVMVSVYLSFALIFLLGKIFKKRWSILNLASASLASALLFFLLTNFAVWYFGKGGWYSSDLSGLLLCYQLAIPFFKNTLYSTLLYNGLLFGVYESSRYWLSQRKKPLIKQT